jgi:hypothetical protein
VLPGEQGCCLQLLPAGRARPRNSFSRAALACHTCPWVPPPSSPPRPPPCRRCPGTSLPTAASGTVPSCGAGARCASARTCRRWGCERCGGSTPPPIATSRWSC